MIRDHNEMERLSAVAGQIRANQILKAMGQAPDFRMDEVKKRELHRAKVHGLKGGENALFKISRWQVQRNIGHGLPGMLFPDMLHTILKGVIEVACGWALQIIWRISKLDAKYRSAPGELEDRLIKMQSTTQAFFPVRPYAFSRGVFDLVKDKAINAAKPVSSFMLGKPLVVEVSVCVCGCAGMLTVLVATMNDHRSFLSIIRIAFHHRDNSRLANAQSIIAAHVCYWK